MFKVKLTFVAFCCLLWPLVCFIFCFLGVFSSSINCINISKIFRRAFCVTTTSCEQFNSLFPNYLQAKTTLKRYFMYLLLGSRRLPPSWSQRSLLVEMRGRSGSIRQASQSYLDLCYLRWAVIKSKFSKMEKKKPDNTHASSHGSPLPPSCANLDMITSEKSRGGSGFTAEMEDRECFCPCIVLHEGKKNPKNNNTETVAVMLKFQLDLICRVAQMAWLGKPPNLLSEVKTLL